MHLTKSETKLLLDIYKHPQKYRGGVKLTRDITVPIATEGLISFHKYNDYGDITDFSDISLTRNGEIEVEKYRRSKHEKKVSYAWDIFRMILSAIIGAIFSKPFWDLVTMLLKDT